uniref:Transmembrane protein 231 n=1 Tax=Globodera pallida TaxID=36090 RepID=A0A183BXU0_GLOPA
MIVSPRRAFKIVNCLLLAITSVAWICALIAGFYISSRFLDSSLMKKAVVHTEGLWHRTNTFLEKPIVRFTENVFFLFETLSYSEQKTLFWSPIAQLNEIAMAKQFELLVPVIETVHSDRDGDSRADEIEIRIAFRLATNATSPPSTIVGSPNFTSLSYALFFDVNLEKRALVELKGAPIFGSFQSQNPFNEIEQEKTKIAVL